MATIALPTAAVFDPDFLIRPPPGRTEGPMGYRLRLAEANFMTLRDISQLDFTYEQTRLADQGLIPPIEVDPDLHAHVVKLSGLLKSKPRMWNHRYSRFCPACLADDPTWQAAWEILFFDACPHHGIWLLDQCSSCSEPVRWNREHLVRCQCGSDLRLELPGQAPDSVRKLSRIMEDKLLGRKTECEPPHVAALDVEQLQRLVRYLGSYMDPASGLRPLKLRNAGSLQTSWPVTSLAAEIIFRWPHSFHESWSRLQSAVQADNTRLGSVFRHAYSYLYKGFWESAFSPVREAFEHWLAENWKGGLCRRNRRLPPDLLASVQWIPGKVAADQLGISVSRLRSLIGEGLIDGQESVTTTGRRFLVVRRDQLEKINLHLANELTMAEAMAMLGIGKIRMQKLLRLLFPSARRINNKEKMPWCVPRNEVNALLEINDRLPFVSTPDETDVSLAHVLRYWTWTAQEVIALIEAVRDGAMIPHALLDSARGVGRWIFEAGQLRTWQASLYRDGKPWVSIPEVAKILDIKQQVAYWLVQNGYLPASDKLVADGKEGARVRREEISHFREQHIYCREIASQLSTSSRKVASLLAEEGIYPLRGDSKHPSRMLIYRYNEKIRRVLVMVTRKSVPDSFDGSFEVNREIQADGISEQQSSNFVGQHPDI